MLWDSVLSLRWLRSNRLCIETLGFCLHSDYARPEEEGAAHSQQVSHSLPQHRLPEQSIRSPAAVPGGECVMVYSPEGSTCSGNWCFEY